MGAEKTWVWIVRLVQGMYANGGAMSMFVTGAVKNLK